MTKLVLTQFNDGLSVSCQRIIVSNHFLRLYKVRKFKAVHGCLLIEFDGHTGNA